VGELADDERGLLWALRWTLLALVVVWVTAGGLFAVNQESRAVARWEVSDGSQ
jgi:hypothetical protein